MPGLLSRRDVLRGGGAVVVSFTFGAVSPKRTAAQAGTNADLGKLLDPREVDSFLTVHVDGSVTVFTGKVDLGQGLRIAVRQMAAEELGLPIERVSLVEGDTGLTPDQGGTGGSSGLTGGGVAVRQAAATARQALLALGAERLNRPAADLALVDGEVRPAAGGPGVAVAALVGGKRFALKVDPNAPRKDPKGYTVVGKPILRPDVPAKCTGQHVYVQDFALPGMVHGRVIRPPAIGAKLLSVDESSIREIPDVRVVRQENFLGVVAKSEWAAVRAARELKATWSEWQGLPGSDAMEPYLRGGTVERDQTVVNKGTVVTSGDVSGPRTVVSTPGLAKTISATYYWPNQSHASLGPSCAVADVRDGGATVWTASQATHSLRGNLAKVFGLSDDKVRVVYLDGAGCYGGNGNDDAAADAVLLSKTVGQPVRVQWMRQEEHAWDPKGPQQLIDVHAGVDANGKIVAWDVEMWVPTTRPGARPLLAAEAAGIPQDNGMGSGALTQNADPPYAVESVRVVAHNLKDTPIRPSNLRAPGKIANVFAVESMTDQLAAVSGVDPLAFRLRGLTDVRAIDVLKRATDMIGWQPRTSPNPQAAQGSLRVGRGLAYMRYKQNENYVAMAMEVAVEPATGRIAVRRVTCAHDCGLVVNPDALRNQIEGCILQTLSRTLHEEVTFDRSRVTSVDWASYPILTFPEVPAIEVALLNHPELPLVGAGEAACAPVAAALANAVFDATGAKLRTVPFTADRVKAALAKL